MHPNSNNLKSFKKSEKNLKNEGKFGGIHSVPIGYNIKYKSNLYLLIIYINF